MDKCFLFNGIGRIVHVLPILMQSSSGNFDMCMWKDSVENSNTISIILVGRIFRETNY